MPTHDAQLFLAGHYVDGDTDEVITVHSPVTGEHLLDLPVPSEAQIDTAVGAARTAFDQYRHWSAQERADLCHRVGDLIEANADELARLTTLEQGKPLHAEAHDDVEDTASLFRVSAEDALRLYGETIPSSARNKRLFTWRAPIGVWAGITPWNFPLMIAAEFIGPALATGNAIVAKPPSITPLAALKLGVLLAEAGVPEGLVSILPGEGAVGERLVTHPGVDAIGFVGSSATAEKIVKAAGLKRSLIEASGNGPVVVLADADIEKAAAAAVYGAYWNAGQVCCATERVIVDASIKDDFVQAALKAAEAVSLGDPFDEKTLMGPLCNEMTASKMDAHVLDAVQNGASVLAGGHRRGGQPTDLYYELTVLDGSPRACSCLARSRSDRSSRSSRPRVTMRRSGSPTLTALGLQAAVFTQSLQRAFRFSQEMKVGSVVVNDSTDYFENAQPFGGAGGTRTGWGRVGGLAQLRDMTDVRTTVISLD